jgi:hypothetical protein
MFAIAARSNVLEAVSISILLFDDLPQILGAVMRLASLVDALVLATSCPTAQASEIARDLRAACPEELAQRASLGLRRSVAPGRR